MTMLQQTIRRRSSRERGATAVEFGLTIGLLTTFVVVAASYFSETLASLVTVANDYL